jgi:hypothetical protein
MNDRHPMIVPWSDDERKHWASVGVRRLVVVVYLIVLALMLGLMGARKAPTFDEFGHLPSGISHWRWGTFDLYRVNPPLIRMLAATPAVFGSDMTIDANMLRDGPYDRPEFAAGQQFHQKLQAKSFWQFTLARWACIPLSLIGAYVVYCWSQKAYGNTPALIALTIYCFCPNVLAWGSAITPDAGAAAIGCAAGFAYWRWWYEPSWKRAVVAGGIMGLAELTKSTWIILYPLCLTLWFLRLTISSRIDKNTNTQAASPVVSVVKELWQLSVVLILPLYILNAGYGFEDSFRQLKEFHFISRSLGGPDAHNVPGNRFRDSFLGELPVPVPANYLRGIDIQKYDFEVGLWSYLRGEWKKGGWWYYYIYAFLLKTPLGIQLLLVLTILLTVVDPRYRRDWRSEIVMLAPSVGVFLIVSSQTGFSRYYRYVLPALPFLYIWISKVGLVFAGKSRALKALVGGCLVWSIISTLSIFPFTLSYFNELAGGPRNGWKYLVDANIDWGQDLLELKTWYDRHPEARPFHLNYEGWADPKIAGIDFQPFPKELFPGANQEPDPVTSGPQLGWYAISAHRLAGFREFDRDGLEFTYLQRFQPTAMAGYSIYIYHLELGEVNRVRTELGLPRLENETQSLPGAEH